MAIFTREAAREFSSRVGSAIEPAPIKTPRFFVDERGPDAFAVLGPNPDRGKRGVSYAGRYLTICTTDGRGEADLIAAALNAHPAAQAWPVFDEVAA